MFLPGESQGRGSLLGCYLWGRTELDTTFTFHFHALEKVMATHSNVLAWRIPGMGKPGVLQFMSDSVRPDGLQRTRLLRRWDSSGKNIGVGCHFLLQYMKVESESESEVVSDS